MAKLVSLFWQFSVVYDAIECIIRCSCGVNVVVVSLNVLFFIFTTALVKPVWASTLDGKALHCLTEKEHLREVHLVGERFFAFKDGGILEIIVTKDVPPKVQRTNTFPVESSVETLKFENHFLAVNH